MKNEFKDVVEILKNSISERKLELLGYNEYNLIHKRKITDINELICQLDLAIKKLES